MGNYYLTKQVNHVGTYDTLAVHVEDVSDLHCQNRSVWKQFFDGLRMLDCRFDTWVDNSWATNLYACHGISKQYYSFGAVWQALKVLLQQYGQETVILSVRSEQAGSGFYHAFVNDFAWYRDHTNMFHHSTTPLVALQNTLLDDVRGKVLIISDDLPAVSPPDPNAGYWARERAFYTNNGQGLFHKGDHYELVDMASHPRRMDHRKKAQLCLANVQLALSDTNPNNGYLTNWNMSNFWIGDGNPVDVAEWMLANGKIKAAYSPSQIGVNGSKPRIGIVELDFYEKLEDQVGNTIRSNRGCGNFPNRT